MVALDLLGTKVKVRFLPKVHLSETNTVGLSSLCIRPPTTGNISGWGTAIAPTGNCSLPQGTTRGLPAANDWMVQELKAWAAPWP